MWDSFFRDGGWGMYPTSIFGFLFVASGVLCLMRPERRFVALVASLGVMTLGSGFLGCCVGFVTSFRYLPRVPVDQRFTIAALGVAESLNNVVLALMLLVITSILCALAAARSALASRPERAEA